MQLNNMSDELFRQKMNISTVAQYEQLRMLFIKLSDDCEYVSVHEDEKQFTVSWGVGCIGSRTFTKGHFEDLKVAADLHNSLKSFYLGERA
ncbi:MAG: hypothetical protein ABNH21_06775 [Glaciecola sp.]